ncbi:MAG: T9SS type A sorting domain-containing protein [Saprospiraceae bacterium]|nr:T9SS type A sorting domain-containing protein [Saprospiraceae bacterium]
MTKLRTAQVLIYLISVSFLYGQQWASVSPEVVAQQLGKRIMPKNFQLLMVNPDELIRAFDQGHVELVLPSGKTQTFRVTPASNFAPGLQKRFPAIRNYLVRSGEDERVSGRIDFSGQGMHAVLHHPEGEIYIDPYQRGDQKYYLVYFTRDFRVSPELKALYNKHEHHFVQDAQHFIDQEPVRSPFSRELEEAVTLRTYRIAICATGEYATNHGGTVEGTLAAINTALNRINFIMESELAIHLQLIENNDELIFFDGDIDPFSDGNPSQMALENNNYLVANIGSANYDVGHVFGSSCNSVVGVSGGVGIVCTGMKGFGASCEISTSDRFYIGIVCHELGHQFGAQHTWNNCPPAPDGQFNGQTAFEPGSGSTIMSYAGSCGNQNVAFDSDNYYHSNSIQAIKNYIMTGGDCAQAFLLENHNPMVSANLEGGFFIPIETPFKLSAVGSDLDGDSVFYNWEQFDAGTGSASFSPIEDPRGDAPIFKSVPPSPDPTRYFPALQKILNNNFDNSEVLPTYDRRLTFRVTARDQKDGGGGVSWDEVTFRAAQTAGPFKIQDESLPLQIEAGSFIEVQWDVASTNLLPVNCQRVNIWLSEDGGKTYPHRLVENAVNDGREFVLIPDLSTENARLMIEAADNIFFDINDSILVITPASESGFALDLSPHEQLSCLPSIVSLDIISFPTGGFTDSVSIISADLPDGVQIIGPTAFKPGDQAVINLDFSQVEASTNFSVKFYFSSSLGDTLIREANISTISSDFSDLSLRQPVQGASSVSQRPTFIWQGSVNADAYVLEVAKSPAFIDPVTAEASGITTVVLDDLLTENTLYYWRVRPANLCGLGEYSPIHAFHTINLSCEQFVSTDVPKTLSQSAIVVAQSEIAVNSSGQISDVNILSVSGSHASFGDLIFSLISPLGKTITLVNQQCGFTNQVFDIGFDDEALDSFSCLTSFNGANFIPQQALSVLNNDPVQGNWYLQVADSVAGSGGRLEGWTLELCGSLAPNPPALSVLDTIRAQYSAATIITEDILNVEDEVVPDAELIYTLVTTPQHGDIRSMGSILSIGDQFSQQEINDGVLTYVHAGIDSLPDSLVVTVVNGQGAWIGPLTIPIEVSTQVVSAFDHYLEGFSIYPNPAKEVLYLENGAGYRGEAHFRIYTVNGSIIKEFRMAFSQLMTIDLNGMVDGVYLAQIASGEGVANLRFIKQ